VLYHTEGWLAKNSEEISPDVVDVLDKSDVALTVESLLEGQDPEAQQGGGGKPAVSKKFREQMKDLLGFLSILNLLKILSEMSVTDDAK
jgi:myosin heavy subunit